MKIQYAKPALTIEEQIKLLESRGMEIEDRDFAERAQITWMFSTDHYFVSVSPCTKACKILS